MTDKPVKIITALFIAVFLFLTVGGIFLGIKVAKEINQHGLKGVAESIWEGNSGKEE